ncbi:hypothetical protein CYMTET_41837 [Cymbomonas tetramitiformis]|uniref:Calx-beta domain-containing protein n=1 Tax=Cymbomonas tetramitiformis TaxID=36881 RepID=A0AAE0C708_9CHLO|nr:hypothetical protein CYMTET_41837 [Cymbomonas tetramitiformis]
MSARFLKVEENRGHVEVEVRRGEGDAPAQVEFYYQDVSAVSGRDYKGPRSRILDFEFGEKVKIIDIQILDNPIKNDDKVFKVVLKKATGGQLKAPTLASRDPLSTTVKVVDDEIQTAERLFSSRGFQFLSVLYTTYALFGTDTALITAPATADDVIGYVTISCVAFFCIEIVLTVAVQGWKYFNTVMFYMDLIAMIALVPSIPAVAELMSGAMGGVSSTGTIARAGRAARAGSRAGRTIKLPKLIGKVVEVSLTIALYLGVTTEDDVDEEEGDDKKESGDKKKNIGATRGEKKKKKKDKTKSKVKVKKDDESDVKKNSEVPSESDLSPSKVGARLMELFTGKVIVMMMLMLVTSTLLEIAMEPFQKELGVQTLDAVYQSVDGDLEHPSFRNALSVYIRGGKPGSKYNPSEELIYLKVGGEIVPRLDVDPDAEDDSTIVPSYMRDTEGNYAAYYDDKDEYERLREVELQFAGGCDVALNKAVNAHTSLNCELAAIFDNAENVHAAAAANMYLTVLIVIILGLGMGLIASDMQKIVLDPIDRVSSFLKMFLPKKEEEDDDGAETEQERNVITEIKENFGHIHKGLMSLTEAIPPEQPLKLIFEAITDVETAFSVKYTSLRRTLLKLEAPIKTMLVEMKKTQSAFIRGKLTRKRLSDSMNLVTQQIMDMLAGIPHDMLRDHPNVTWALKLTQHSLPAVVKFVNNTLVVLEKGLVSMAIFAQIPRESEELTNEEVSDLWLKLVRGIVRRTLTMCGQYDLAHRMGSASIEEMLNIFNNHIKKDAIEMLRKLGLDVDHLDWKRMKLVDVTKAMNAKIAGEVLALLPESLRSQMPESLRQAHTGGLHQFQEELQVFVVNQSLEAVSQLRKTPSHSLVTDQMVERIQEVTLAFRSGRVGVVDSLNRVSSLVQEICVQHLSLGFPMLDEARQMKLFFEEMQIAHASQSYELFLEKVDYNPQMFASLLGSVPLPTREQMLSDPKRYVEELRSMVHSSRVPEMVDKQLKKSLHAAVEEMRSLMSLIPNLPTSAAAATALGEEAARKLLHRLVQYRHLVPANMAAGFSWPTAASLDTLPAARVYELLADVAPMLRTVEARFSKLPMDLLQLDTILEKLNFFRRQMVSVDLVEQNIGPPMRKMVLAASTHMGLGYTEEALQALGLQGMMWNFFKDLGTTISRQVQTTSKRAVLGAGHAATVAQELGTHAARAAEAQVAGYAQGAKDHAQMLVADGAAAASSVYSEIDLPGTPMSGIRPGRPKLNDSPMSGIVHMGLTAGSAAAVPAMATLEEGLGLDAGTVGAAMGTLGGSLASAGAAGATWVEFARAAATAMGAQGLEQMQRLMQTNLRATAEEAGLASFLQEGLDMNSLRDVLTNGLHVQMTQHLEKLEFGQFGTLLRQLSLPDLVSSVRAMATSSVSALTESAVNSAMGVLEKLPKPSQLTSMTDDEVWELLRARALRSSLGNILPAPLLALLPDRDAPMSSSLSAPLAAVRALLPIARQVALSKLDTRLHKLVRLADLLHFLQSIKTSADIDRRVLSQLLAGAGYPEALSAVMPKAVSHVLPSLEVVEQMPSEALDDMLRSLGASLGPALATTQRLTHEATAFLESQDVRKVDIPAHLVMKLATINSVGTAVVSPEELYDLAFRLQGMASDLQHIPIPSIEEMTASPQKKDALMASLRTSGLPQLAAKLSRSLPANLQLNLARLNAASIEDMPEMELQWILRQIGYPEVFQQRGAEPVPSLDEVLANRKLLKKPLNQFKLTGTIGLESIAMHKMESAMSQLSHFTSLPVFDLLQVGNVMQSAASMLPNGIAVSGAHVADLGSNLLQMMHNILGASPETARLDKAMESMVTQLEAMRQSGRENLDDINTWLSFLQQNLSIEHLELAAVKIQSMVRGAQARERFKSFQEVKRISQAKTSNTSAEAKESAEIDELFVRSHASLSTG